MTTENTTTNAATTAGKATDAVVTKAAKAAARTADVVNETLPTVVETVEVAMEVPAKVVLNQKLVVTAAIVGGVAAGALGLWGAQKLRARLAAKRLEAELVNIAHPDDEVAES